MDRLENDLTTGELRQLRSEGRLAVRGPAHYGAGLIARAAITLALLGVGWVIQPTQPSVLTMIIGAVIGYWLSTGEGEVERWVERNGKGDK